MAPPLANLIGDDPALQAIDVNCRRESAEGAGSLATGPGPAVSENTWQLGAPNASPTPTGPNCRRESVEDRTTGTPLFTPPSPPVVGFTPESTLALAESTPTRLPIEVIIASVPTPEPAREPPPPAAASPTPKRRCTEAEAEELRCSTPVFNAKEAEVALGCSAEALRCSEEALRSLEEAEAAAEEAPPKRRRTVKRRQPLPVGKGPKV
jgi:hypothetical protein